MENGKVGSSITERHIQTILGALIIGLVSWVGYTTSSTARDVAVLKTQFANMEDRIADLKDIMKDRFTGQQGDRLIRRVERLEQQVFYGKKDKE